MIIERFLKFSKRAQISNGMKAVEDILASFRIIFIFQRELLLLSNEGANALMSDYPSTRKISVDVFRVFK